MAVHFGVFTRMSAWTADCRPGAVLLQPLRIALLLLALVAAGCGHGVGEDEYGVPIRGPNPYLVEFNKIDSAHVGRITLDQALAYYNKLYSDLDVKHTGLLDAAALRPAVPMMQAQTPEVLIIELDQNGDGKLSREEFVVVANWLFQRARTNPNELLLADVERASADGPPLRRPVDPRRRPCAGC